MKAHHQLTSAPGTGTTIRLTVPLTTPAEPTKPA
jgi:hypothetical protein